MRILFLVGLPASGKSTFRNEMTERVVTNKAEDPYVFISSDDKIEEAAELRQHTYNEVFQDSNMIDFIMNLTDSTFRKAVKDKKYIVIDRTNMSVKSRSKYLQIARAAGYGIDAVVFARPMTDAAHNEWNKRLDRPGKTIPVNVLQDMFRSYVRPTKEEGFDNVIDINTFAEYS